MLVSLVQWIDSVCAANRRQHSVEWQRLPPLPPQAEPVDQRRRLVARLYDDDP
jgi:hypothetical protein